jgi:hypothetical protein
MAYIEVMFYQMTVWNVSRCMKLVPRPLMICYGYFSKSCCSNLVAVTAILGFGCGCGGGGDVFFPMTVVLFLCHLFLTSISHALQPSVGKQK